MFKHSSSHLGAVLQALFVTFLWSTSWVLIKIGLQNAIPALTFAGLRYTLAFLCLLPFALRPGPLAALRSLPGRSWARLALLGLLVIAVTQGAQFLGLQLVRSTITVSLLLNFSTVLVALMGIFLLAEKPTIRQWGGLALYLVGVLIYFYPVAIPAGEGVGLLVVIVGVVANAVSAVLGRGINRDKAFSPLLITVVSMGVGSAILLLAGLLTEGVPTLNAQDWAIVGWLAVVNTALAFTIWNHTLRTLSAMESSIINNTMLVQIAILAWLFLGEQIGWKQGLGMALVVLATLLVQLRRRVRTVSATE